MDHPEGIEITINGLLSLFSHYYTMKRFSWLEERFCALASISLIKSIYFYINHYVIFFSIFIGNATWCYYLMRNYIIMEIWGLISYLHFGFYKWVHIHITILPMNTPIF